MRQVVGGEHSLKISGPQLLRFGREDILKIWRKRMSQFIILIINNKGVYRTAPATPGRLIKSCSHDCQKLGGVGPIDYRPSIDQLQHFAKQKRYFARLSVHNLLCTIQCEQFSLHSLVTIAPMQIHTCDRGDTCSTSATWCYRQQYLEEKDE